MPTPQKAATQQGSEVLTALPSSVKREAQIPLPENSPFQYWVDPGRVTFLDGVARWNPARIGLQPGVQNVTGDGDPTMSDAFHKKAGRTLIPIDFPCTAWGKKTSGYLVRMDIGHDPLGKQLWHFHDVWTKYERFGAQMVPSFDNEGWAQFCRDAERLAGPVPDHAASAERLRITQQIREHDRMASRSPGAADVAAELRAKITPAAPAA